MTHIYYEPFAASGKADINILKLIVTLSRQILSLTTTMTFSIAFV